MALEAFAVVADLTKARGDLFLGPFWVADEVEVAVFLAVQLREFGLELFAQGAGGLVLRRVGGVDCFADLGL